MWCRSGSLEKKGKSRLLLHSAHLASKKVRKSSLSKSWVPHDVRDAVVDYVRHWSERTEIPAQRFVAWLGIAASKFYGWRERYGLANEHNAHVPRDWWLEGWEKEA
ncbi:MAG TPA: hypothetical protein VKP69_30565, partial [Isosphaeraceae bacterium]|nr:hypothetical protein [Isosphaeraceae bacterium]